MVSKDQNKVIIPVYKLKELGFIPEQVEEIEQGQYYQTFALVKGDSFIQVENQMNGNEEIYHQYIDVRVILDGYTDYDLDKLQALKKLLG